MSRERTAGRQGGNTATHFAVCVWTQRRRVGTGRRQTGKGPDGSREPLMLQSVCCRASEKSVLYVTTQLMTMRLKVVSCFGVGGDLVSFNKKLVTEITASQNHAKQGLLVLESGKTNLITE